MVEKYLYSGSLYKDFSELCTRYHIALANLSPEVVDKIVHFEYGKNVGTMRHYLKRAIFNKSMTKKPIPTENLKKELREIIEKKYSCCERKIIAKLEADGLSSRNAILYIKLSPCESCADALSYWKKKQRCEWKITYLYQ